MTHRFSTESLTEMARATASIEWQQHAACHTCVTQVRVARINKHIYCCNIAVASAVGGGDGGFGGYGWGRKLRAGGTKAQAAPSIAV
jgi:hypothetical protein